MYSQPHPDSVPTECENCGGTQGLLRCSRCRTAFFCSAACQRAHWPFHKGACNRNEFADAIEDSDAKFAAWMRSHGKQAVLKDDEVDRIERAAAAACGTQSREEVISSMYGRADPRPAGPSYSPEERRRMRHREEAETNETRRLTPAQRVWREVEVPPGLGLDCETYKWRQSQSHLELFVRLPAGAESHKVTVDIGKQHLWVKADGTHLVGGALLRTVVPHNSMWQLRDGIVEVTLLKASRRGHYAPGKNNADTFWNSVWAKPLPQDTLPAAHPPLDYYSSAYDASDDVYILPPPPARPAVAQPLRPAIKA